MLNFIYCPNILFFNNKRFNYINNINCLLNKKMLFEPPNKKNKINVETNQTIRKITWKDKLKSEFFRKNLQLVRENQKKKKKDIYQMQDQNEAAKELSNLMDKNKTIYLRDEQQEFPNHGFYSSYIPLPQQQKLNDQLKNTFPYVEYLAQKNHIQSKKIIYDQISHHIRTCIQNNTVQIGWRNCLKKYLCDLDTIKAIEIYIEFLKKGTVVLDEYHKKYSNGCSKQVFFHRVCQSSKYFKQSFKLNKNIKTSLQTTDQISEATLPKTCKYLYCKICMLYDCNHHNNDSILDEYNYQYVAKKNIVSESRHVNNILTLIKFHQKLINQNGQKDSQQSKTDKFYNKNMIIQQKQEGEEDQFNPNVCSTDCYLHLTPQTYKKKKASRRPIISMIQRSMIKMGINIFSYEPHLLYLWMGSQSSTKINQQINQLKGMSCQNIFFYLLDEYNLIGKLQMKLFNSEYDMLTNQSSIPINQQTSHLIPNKTKKKKNKNQKKFNHQDNDNYSIGCCFHYIIGEPVLDQKCEKCYCRRRGFCLASCQCTELCPIRKKGCLCKNKDQCKNNKCPCYQNTEECIPGVCLNCYDSHNHHNKKNNCRNSLLSMRKKKNIKIADSNIEGCGLGAFAGQDIEKDELAIIYTGEMILHQIDYIRQSLRIDNSFYNFSLNEGGSTDARFMGNKSRFINHNGSGQQNLKAISIFSEGQFRTCLISNRNIKKGEELFFDYDADGTLAQNFPGKYPFIQPKKKRKNAQNNK